MSVVVHEVSPGKWLIEAWSYGTKGLSVFVDGVCVGMSYGPRADGYNVTVLWANEMKPEPVIEELSV
jgi:hypothetical protein